MIDQYTNLRTAYYSLLQDSITLGGNTVNVYDMVQANESTPYIYFGEFEAVEDSTKGKFTQRVTIGISVITKYTNAVGGSADSDNIVNQVLKLLHNDTYLSGSSYRVVLNKLLANFTTKQPTETGTRVVKTIRMEHLVEQIGGDLTRITDLTATRASTTQIDLAWSNVTGNTGYRIERSTDAATWSLVTTVAQDSTSYSNTGLTADTVYHYRVRAFDSSGGSAWSNIATAVTSTIVSASGIAYLRPLLDGQSTSYTTYDTGWHLANGTYSYTAPIYPVSYAKLDEDAANPFLTLENNNAFGNTNRFTDEDGLQVYGSSYTIDHLTGLGWQIGVNGFETWADAISSANSSTLAGFSDWRLPNSMEIESIANREAGGAYVLNYAPFNNTNGDRKWLGTSFNSTNALFFQTYSKAFFVKTNTARSFYVRNHYS